MKFVVTLFAIIGLSITAPSLNLESDLLDFLELIPLEDIQTIVDKRLRNDKEFQAAVQYFQSDEWSNVVDNLDKLNETIEAKKYLLNAGIDVEFIGAIIEEIIGDMTIKSHNNKRSMKKFLEEVHSIIPYQELLNLYLEKLEKSTYFQEFIDKITSERFHLLVENMLETEEAQEVLDTLESMDVEIRKSAKAVYAFVGWKESNNI